MNLPRSSGLLLHPTSLPGPFGIGDLGPQAYAFADFLHSARQSLWQVLPLAAEKIHDAGLEGDQLALEVFRRMGVYLGIGLANLINIITRK